MNKHQTPNIHTSNTKYTNIKHQIYTHQTSNIQALNIKYINIKHQIYKH